MADQSFDVVIVGGAAVGSSAAYFLSSSADFSGSIAVIEPDPTYRYSATTRSVASIRHQFSTRENIEMSIYGSEFIRSFAQRMEVGGQRPDVAFREIGYLFIATRQGLPILEANVDTQRALGAGIELLTPGEVAARYPWLNVDDVAGASFGTRGEGWLDAHGMLMGTRRRAMANGVRYLPHRVVALERRGHRVDSVTLDDGTRIRCGALVNAAGAGGPGIARMAGIELPVEPRKRSVFFVQCPQQLPDCPMVIDASGAYFRPEGTGFLTGIAPPADDDPPSDDFDVQHELYDALWPLIAHRVPAFEALRCTRSWAGHYDINTVDRNMILGLHPDLENLYFANGFSGHGVQHSPAVGRALMELIVHGAFRTLDLSRMGWARIIEERPIAEANVI